MLQHDRFFVPQRQEKLQFCCAHLHGQAPRVPSRLLWQEFRHVHVILSVRFYIANLQFHGTFRQRFHGTCV